jgi:hypothetical protein
MQTHVLPLELPSNYECNGFGDFFFERELLCMDSLNESFLDLSSVALFVKA